MAATWGTPTTWGDFLTWAGDVAPPATDIPGGANFYTIPAAPVLTVLDDDELLALALL